MVIEIFFAEKKKRPVLILGALTDPFIAKLLEDYPRMFSQCVPGKENILDRI